MSSWDKEWAMCFSGRHVMPFDIKPSDVELLDIAHQTGMQCRYNGAVERFYSVGEHQIRIAQALRRDGYGPTVAFKGLIHDAGETYTGDFTRPVKNSLREVGLVLKAAEDRNAHAIMAHFGLEGEDPIIKEYDRRIIVDEKNTLFGVNKPWDWDLEPLNVPIIGWAPGTSYDWHPFRVRDEYMSLAAELIRDPAFKLVL